MPPEVVAYRTPEGIICTDVVCLTHYCDLMQLAVPLTEDDIRAEQDNREGRSVRCESCMDPLDLWTITAGASY